MGAEHAAVVAQLGQLFEGGDQAIAFQLGGGQQVEGVVIGFGFLGLRELGIDQFLGQIADLGGGQRGNGGIAGRGGCLAGGAGGVGNLHGFLRMAERDMADFVADDAAQFVVVHLLHQAGIDAHAAVVHGPGVDFPALVHLVVEGDAFDLLGHALDQPGEALRRLALGRRDLGLAIHLGAGLVGQLHHVGVAQCHGLGCCRRGLEQPFGIGAGSNVSGIAAGGQGEGSQDGGQ